MSFGKPRYEHAVKWTEIVPLLTSGDPEQIKRAEALLIAKDSDLEDNWPGGGGGVVSAGEIVDFQADSAGTSHLPPNTVFNTAAGITLTAPAASATYRQIIWVQAQAYADGSVAGPKNLRVAFVALQDGLLRGGATQTIDNVNSDFAIFRNPASTLSKFYVLDIAPGASHDWTVQVINDAAGGPTWDVRFDVEIMGQVLTLPL